MIEDTSLQNNSVEKTDYPDMTDNDFDLLWDYTMRQVASIPDFSTSRQQIAEELNNTSLNDLDSGMEKAFIQSGKVTQHDLDVAYAIGNLTTVTPDTSLETAAGDTIASDKMITEPTYKINTGTEASYKSPGIGFTRNLLLQRAIGRAASKRNVKVGETVINRMVIPTVVGAVAGGTAGAFIGKSIGSTAFGTATGALISDVTSSIVDYLRTGGVSFTKMQQDFNNDLEAILNDDRLSEEQIDEAVENVFKERVDVWPKDMQGQIMQSAAEGVDPYADMIGIMPGVGVRLYIRPIEGTTEAAIDFVSGKYNKRYVSNLKVNDKLKEQADKLAKHTQNETEEVSKKAEEKAIITAPENATETEKEIVAAINTPEEADKSIYTASVDIESDFPFNVVNKEIDEEKGAVVFYHGSDDGKALTYTQAKEMIEEYSNLTGWDKGRQVVTTASKKPFKTFKISTKTRKSGEGSESLGRAGYVSAITDDEAARYSYLSIMNDAVNDDITMNFNLPSDAVPDWYRVDRGLYNAAKERFFSNEDIIRNPKTDVNKFVQSKIDQLEESKQAALEKINRKQTDRQMINHYLNQYVVDSVEQELYKRVKNTDTNLMTLTIADPDLYPNNYLTFKKPFSPQEQPAMKKIAKELNDGMKLYDKDTLENILPATSAQDAIAKKFVTETLITPIDMFDYFMSGIGYDYAKKNWRKYLKEGKEIELNLDIKQIPVEDLGINITHLFDFKQFSLDLNDYARKVLKKKGIWYWEHSNTNYAVYDERAFGPVTKQERWRGNKYEQKFLDNGFGIVYDINQNGYYVPEIKYFDVSKKKPIVFKQDKRNFRYTPEEIFNNVATKEN